MINEKLSEFDEKWKKNCCDCMWLFWPWQNVQFVCLCVTRRVRATYEYSETQPNLCTSRIRYANTSIRVAYPYIVSACVCMRVHRQRNLCSRSMRTNQPLAAQFYGRFTINSDPFAHFLFFDFIFFVVDAHSYCLIIDINTEHINAVYLLFFFFFFASLCKTPHAIYIRHLAFTSI